MRGRRGTHAGLRGTAALVAALVVVAVAPAAANAFIYWTNHGVADAQGPTGTTIGRIGNDLSGYTPSYISTGRGPCGVTTTDGHVYWAVSGTASGNGAVSRATHDLAEINHDFHPGLAFPCGVAVTGIYVYYANNDGIGRVTLDGNDSATGFITMAPVGQPPITPRPRTVAVHGNHVYWIRDIGAGSLQIGRADTDGLVVEHSWLTVSGDQSGGLAVTDTHVFWSDLGRGTIGRATRVGDSAGASEPLFIAGARGPCGITVHGAHLYWGNFYGAANKTGRGTTIGRANLDGSGVNQSYVQGASGPCGVAVDDRTGAVAPGPTAATAEATDITTTGARLRGAVNPNGASTVYRFEWGPTTNYGNQIPSEFQDAGSDKQSHDVVADLGGLTPNTTYHYRIVAFNGDGTSYGLDQTFRTQKIPDPRNVQDPRLTAGGELFPGTTLTCSPGVWENADTYEFNWTVGVNVVRSDAVQLASPAAKSEYTIKEGDQNKPVYCAVIARGPGGRIGAFSDFIIPKCREITIAGRDIRSVEPGKCFKTSGAGRFSFDGAFTINGLEFDGGATFDAAAKTVSLGRTQVSASKVILTRQTFDEPLNLADGDHYLIKAHATPGLTLFGMDIARSSYFTVKLKGKKAQVGLHVAPKLMFVGEAPAHGEVEWEGDDNGFHFHGLKFAVHHAHFGAPHSGLEIEDAEFEYSSDGESTDACGQKFRGKFWRLKVGEIKMPWIKPVKISKVKASVVNGGLRELGGGAGGLNIPAGPGLLIHRIGAYLCLGPFATRGEIDMSYAKYVKLDGSVTFRPVPYLFEAKANGVLDTGVKFLPKIPIGNATVTLDRDGGFGFDATIHARAGGFAEMTGQIRGGAAPSGAFMFGGSLEVCVGYCAKGAGIVSSRGIAGCAAVIIIKRREIGFITIPEVAGHVQIGLRWGHGVDWGAGLGSNCDFGPYEIVVARGAQAGPPSVTVPEATEALLLKVTGEPGRRRVVVSGPGGRSIDTDLPEEQLANEGVAVKDSGDTERYVTIAKAAAGTWTVTPKPGSVVRSVEPQVPQPTPVLDANVSTTAGAATAVASAATARRRTLRYDLRIPAGGEVRLVEAGDKVVRPLKTLRAAPDQQRRLVAPMRRLRGSVTFRPTLAISTNRAIVAELGRGGTVWSQRVLTQFRAPRWSPPTTPRGLRATRAGARVLVSWRAVPGADQYEVAGRATDGSTVGATVSGTRIRLTLPTDAAAAVAVRARRSDGLLGPQAVARVALPASARALRSLRVSKSTLTIRLRQPATVRFTLLRGRRTVARFKVPLGGGTTSVPFDGRFGKRRLAPGTYVLKAVSTDQTRAKSTARTTFRIGG